MSRSPLDIDDLVEHWTLLPDELDLVVRLHEPSRLVFAVWLKFYTRHGRFPRGRGEVHDDAAAFVARQLKVSAGDLGLMEWSGRTAERHRATIRGHLGFRECSTADAEKLTGVDGDLPVLAILAVPDGDNAFAGRQLHVVDVERDDFAQAQPRVVGQQGHDPVAGAEPAFDGA